MNQRQAIILFVRDETREGRAKPLPGALSAAGYRSINLRIAQRLAGLADRGVDLLVVGERPETYGIATAALRQRGGSFGERLANALTDAFALGYDRVAAVGNDCPSIERSDIASALAMLDTSGVVAAPATDGGSYLIAARADGFDRDAFVSLPWCTDHLFAALVAMPTAAALPVVRDDFDDWTTSPGRRALARLLHIAPPVPAIPPFPVVSRSVIKSLTRIHLPAPPRR